jgi:hypothetical protein
MRKKDARLKYYVILALKSVPLLFIGGSPRSGVGFMRSVLSVHPKLSICIPEVNFRIF